MNPNFKRITQASLAMVLSASMMIACSKGGNDTIANTPLTSMPFGGGCGAMGGGCPQVPTIVANATSNGYGLMFSFQVFGDQYAVMNAQAMGGIYQGPIAVGGTLQVMQPQQIGNCYLQAGSTYTVQTVQGGVASGSNINGLRFAVTGPGGSFLMSFQGGASYLSTSQRIVGYLTVEQGTSPYMGGGTVPCNDPLGPLLMN